MLEWKVNAIVRQTKICLFWLVQLCWGFLSWSMCRFYTLMVLSTALFDRPAFQNLICNGLVLAEDGKKMSKRLNNYPPPTDIINEYGAVSGFSLYTSSVYTSESYIFVEVCFISTDSFRVHSSDCWLLPILSAGCIEIVSHKFSCCKGRAAQV